MSCLNRVMFCLGFWCLLWWEVGCKGKNRVLIYVYGYFDLALGWKEVGYIRSYIRKVGFWLLVLS